MLLVDLADGEAVARLGALRPGRIAERLNICSVGCAIRKIAKLLKSRASCAVCTQMWLRGVSSADPGGSRKGKPRFWLDIPNQALTTYRGRELYVNGFVAGVEGVALWGSGAKRFPDPPVFRDVPESLPPLAGAYVSTPQHPRVFTTPADLPQHSTGATRQYQ